MSTFQFSVHIMSTLGRSKHRFLRLGIQSYVNNEIPLSSVNLKQLKTSIRSQASALFHNNKFSRFRHVGELGGLVPPQVGHTDHTPSLIKY